MPVTQKGEKFYVKDKEFDTQDAANKAYMDYLSAAMGVKKTVPKKKEIKNGKKMDSGSD